MEGLVEEIGKFEERKVFSLGESLELSISMRISWLVVLFEYRF